MHSKVGSISRGANYSVGGPSKLTVSPIINHTPSASCVLILQHQTKTVRLQLYTYPKETNENSFAIHKCSVSTSIDLTPFSSTLGKTFPTCNLFIPTFRGYFADPCERYLATGDHFKEIPHNLFRLLLLSHYRPRYNILSLTKRIRP